MELTVSKEDYLKAIAEAEAEEGPVIAATIGRWLDISAPAVTLAVRRLRRDKLVTVGAGGRVQLTPQGRAVTNRLRLRHHLIERMLHEMLGVEWYKVHDEAERLEHSVSPDVERHLVEKLGREGLCPHGNPINKSTAERRRAGLKLLWEAPAGAALRIAGMHERDRGLLEYFDRLGLRPGIELSILGRNYDETLSLQLASGPVTLAAAAAQKIWVAAAQAAPRAPRKKEKTA